MCHGHGVEGLPDDGNENEPRWLPCLQCKGDGTIDHVTMIDDDPRAIDQTWTLGADLGEKEERYRCVMADPPWNEQGGGKVKRGADRHYPLMKTKDIIETMRDVLYVTPFRELGTSLVAPNSHLWLWVTNNYLEDGLEVMRALGYRYVTNMAWAKDRFGIGYYLRGQHELCLFGVRGVLPPLARNNPSLVNAIREAHSRKPDATYERIEAVSPGPRLEMFARRERPGWDVWGNEV